MREELERLRDELEEREAEVTLLREQLREREAMIGEMQAALERQSEVLGCWRRGWRDWGVKGGWRAECVTLERRRSARERRIFGL